MRPPKFGNQIQHGNDSVGYIQDALLNSNGKTESVKVWVIFAVKIGFVDKIVQGDYIIAGSSKEILEYILFCMYLGSFTTKLNEYS